MRIFLVQMDYESEDVNAVQQALPTIMVLPSDNLLEEYNSLKTQTIDNTNTRKKV